MDAILNRRNSRLFVGGAQHILNLPDFQDIGKFQTVLSLLEQEQALADMGERYSIKQGVSVTIGEEISEEMKECSLVLAPRQDTGAGPFWPHRPPEDGLREIHLYPRDHC